MHHSFLVIFFSLVYATQSVGMIMLYVKTILWIACYWSKYR